MYKKRQHNSIYFRHFYPHVQKAEPRAAESFSAITKRFIRFTPSLSAETQPAPYAAALIFSPVSGTEPVPRLLPLPVPEPGP